MSVRAKDDARIPVIYIAGYGRSGSTLLERLLGNEPGCVAVGEIRHIWERSFLQDQLCSCGSSFHDCSFWKRVLDIGFGGDGQDTAAQIIALRQSIEGYAYLPHMLIARRSRAYESKWSEYSRALVSLYRAIQCVSGAHYIVDSSKDPPYLFLLSTIAQIELHVVHLVRDPRAVAHSWKRRKLRPEVVGRSEYMPQYSYWKSSREWVIHNVATQCIQLRSVDYIRIRYEDLTTRPGETMASLRTHISSSSAPGAGSTADLVREPALNHTVSGNPLRFQRGDIPIKEDTEWLGMPWWGKALVTIGTLPLCAYHGYSVWPRTA